MDFFSQLQLPQYWQKHSETSSWKKFTASILIMAGIRTKDIPLPSTETAIMKYGITPYHRKSFNLFDTQLKFEF